ncbi:MAG: hypothetical protein COZ21_06910 [Bacteroidetes bacterium CG_4_10_14_3_um_filter_31_20]|nr:MAG: hypothetical protein COZ21_06910 [Bacteroidetes bacterium CG_4_10_14_3_um_filter_31_20]
MMIKYVGTGDSIECEASCIVTRKVSPKPIFIKIEALDGTFVNFFKYKTKIRATVTIIKELNPKEPIIDDISKLDLDSTLEAGTVEIYTKSRIKLELTSNFTSTHTIQNNIVNIFTYAKIVIPWQFMLDRALSV